MPDRLSWRLPLLGRLLTERSCGSTLPGAIHDVDAVAKVDELFVLVERFAAV